MIYGIAIFIVVLAVDLYTDVRRYYKHRKVNHTRGAVLRVIGMAPAVYFLHWTSIPMILFWYWVLFNGLYNVFIGQKWEFVGTTAKIDQLQQKNRWMKWLKYIGLVTSTILYLLL